MCSSLAIALEGLTIDQLDVRARESGDVNVRILLDRERVGVSVCMRDEDWHASVATTHASTAPKNKRIATSPSSAAIMRCKNTIARGGVMSHASGASFGVVARMCSAIVTSQAPSARARADRFFGCGSVRLALTIGSCLACSSRRSSSDRSGAPVTDAGPCRRGSSRTSTSACKP